MDTPPDPRRTDVLPGAVGILGAGRAGTALARALARIPQLSPGVGVPRVLVAGTRRPSAVQRHLTVYAPQARAVSPDELSRAEVTVVAVPREALDDVDPAHLAGATTRAVVDMTNAWGDEPVPAWLTGPGPGTALLAERWAATGLNVPLIRALSEISHHDLDVAGRARPPRRALAVGVPHPGHPCEAPAVTRAGATVAALVEAMGFDAVPYAGYDRGAVLEPGAAGFGDEHTAAELHALLTP